MYMILLLSCSCPLLLQIYVTTSQQNSGVVVPYCMYWGSPIYKLEPSIACDYLGATPSHCYCVIEHPAVFFSISDTGDSRWSTSCHCVHQSRGFHKSLLAAQALWLPQSTCWITSLFALISFLACFVSFRSFCCQIVCSGVPVWLEKPDCPLSTFCITQFEGMITIF